LGLYFLCSCINDVLIYHVQVKANVNEHNYANGLKDVRKPRSNHDEERVSKLLAIPHYAEAVYGDNGEESAGENVHCQRNLVCSRKDWRREFHKWQKEVQRYDEDSGEDSDAELNPPQGNSKWLPHSMKLLFGKESDVRETATGNAETGGHPDHCARRRTAWSEEALHMELLAQEENDEILDDGAKEGSGDEYGED